MRKHNSNRSRVTEDPRLAFAEDLHEDSLQTCPDCGEDLDGEFYFSSECHPDCGKVKVHYLNGLVRIECGICGNPICDIVPASNGLCAN